MSTNWMRHFELQILDEGGKGVSLTDLKVTFDIERNDNKWPATATVKVYNLSANTTNRILQREFSKIRIIAGYDGIAPDVDSSQVGKVRELTQSEVGQFNDQNFGIIFSGDIRFTVTGKDNATDSYVLIQACDSLEAFINATIMTTIAKGYTLEDVYKLLMKQLEPFGVVGGIVPEFPKTVFPRGKTFYGMVHDYLDNLAEQLNATWQFSYGKVDIITKDIAAHKAVVLNSNAGLIGMPQQTIGGGVNITCLINSRIQLHGLVQLDQRSVYRTKLNNQDIYSGGFSEKDENGNLVVTGKIRDANGNLIDGPATAQPASIATDGVYIVRYISYRGDTRGQLWYMEMACEARGAADIPSSSFLQKQA
ncbi:hypothetical protein [Serratia liquefaciens]|uniref:hypothetical protein n=1 Tax=Serratia liquefaciens TaxID=614 RepID=UPI0039067F62